MNVGKLTKEELDLLRETFDRFAVMPSFPVQYARATLLMNGYSTPPGHYFDEKLVRSGCVLSTVRRNGFCRKYITILPKEVL